MVNKIYAANHKDEFRTNTVTFFSIKYINFTNCFFISVNDNPKPSALPSHMQPPPPSLPTLVPVRPNMPNSTPTLLPSSPTILPASPPTISQGLQPTFQPTLVAPVARAPAQYANVGQTPPVTSSGAVSGMVPIRNTLYSQGLTSSVLLQPLNEVGCVRETDT